MIRNLYELARKQGISDIEVEIEDLDSIPQQIANLTVRLDVETGKPFGIVLVLAPK